MQKEREASQLHSTPGKPNQKRRGQILAGVLTLIWLLMLIPIALFMIQKSSLPETIDIPYSIFSHQIEEGNIQTVTFIGQSDIVGTLKYAIVITDSGRQEIITSFHTVEPPNGDLRLRRQLIDAGVKILPFSPHYSIREIALMVILLVMFALFFFWFIGRNLSVLLLHMFDGRKVSKKGM